MENTEDSEGDSSRVRTIYRPSSIPGTPDIRYSDLSVPVFTQAVPQMSLILERLALTSA